MIGITNHESFYFLEFDYNFDEILKHTFTYASLINTTNNLVKKLTTIDTNKQVNICLKKHLLKFYKITNISYLDKKSAELIKNVESLKLIDDFEFNLPMITHLKLHLENNNNNSNYKFYAYQFNFQSQFNYMLNKSLPFSDVYKKVYKSLNQSVIPHFSELDYVFGLPILSRENLLKYKTKTFDYNYSNMEYELSLLMIKYWSNFAKYGYINLKY